ncbi:hypothetical protein ET475_09930 [Microbacterium protaetiae]|uniref:Uncharacterized protein n=1 Tax=Microbacterium protaetiae TaxID=2509458 RepID=A0A4P6EDD7_9MICO|nr:hypothetical protein [Microbacterium protaetiae]QAY60272.1 hypothetical protein ET475_09930 [Microbacterium protaetiae]
MTMHPSLGYDIITQELEERARNAERARFVREHPEQIVRLPRKRWISTIARLFHPLRHAVHPQSTTCDSAHAS